MLAGGSHINGRRCCAKLAEISPAFMKTFYGQYECARLDRTMVDFDNNPNAGGRTWCDIFVGPSECVILSRTHLFGSVVAHQACLRRCSSSNVAKRHSQPVYIQMRERVNAAQRQNRIFHSCIIKCGWLHNLCILQSFDTRPYNAICLTQSKRQLHIGTMRFDVVI